MYSLHIIREIFSRIIWASSYPFAKLGCSLYQRWCDGEFIDAYTETLPQRKSRQLHEQGIEIGQRQVDIYAGLNVMILLLELNRYARERDDLKEEIVFYPSGVTQDARFRNQLLRVINYSDAIQLGTFNNLVKRYLDDVDFSSANLSSADFSRGNFSGLDLSSADLSGTYLSGVDFSDVEFIEANLSATDLSYADLSSANLSNANLSSANLSNVYLYGAYLSGANLSSANLSSANLSYANLSDEVLGDICWDENTIWEGVQGLETARNVPEALKKQLGLSD